MPPKVTSSSNRSKRSSSKPVTQGQNPQRANRQKVSQAKNTGSGVLGRGGQFEHKRGDTAWTKVTPQKSNRVTTSSQRTSTGSARVTTSDRPALPPGNRGGAVTKPNSNKPAAPRSNGGPVQPVRVRDMGKPTKPSVSGSGSRPALGAGNAPKPNAAGGGVRGLLKGRAPISLGGLRGGLLGVAGGMAADYVGTKAGNALGTALRPLGRAIDDRLPGVNSKDEERRRNASAAATGNNSRFAGARDREIERARNIQPTPARPASPAASSGRSGGGGSYRPAPGTGRSTSPKPPSSSPKPPAAEKETKPTTDAPKESTETAPTKKESLKIASGRRPVGREEMIADNIRRARKNRG